MDASDPAYAGQHFYSSWFLRVYDLLVLGLFANLVWRCPTRLLVRHYSQNLGRRHLDVGPGTGYFFERARLPLGFSLSLLDPNLNVLAHSSRRLTRLNPSLLHADVTRPLNLNRRFDSIAINYVLHCLPGPMSGRSGAIHSLAQLLDPGGVLFGATVLGTPELHTWLSLAALRDNNQRGIFDNLSDTEDALRELLSGSFGAVDIHVVGSVAVFTARMPTSAS
jgi:ubiquinone/menaquinone biosynthesis C-methylase UbiE